MQLQSLTWSDYKKQHCQVVGIAPNGMISFLSDSRWEEEHQTNALSASLAFLI